MQAQGRLSGRDVGHRQACFDLAKNDRNENGNSGKAQIPPTDLIVARIFGEVTNHIAHKGEQGHGNDEVHHDGVNGVRVRKVVFIEGGQILKHGCLKA